MSNEITHNYPGSSRGSTLKYDGTLIAGAGISEIKHTYIHQLPGRKIKIPKNQVFLENSAHLSCKVTLSSLTIYFDLYI